MKEYDVGDWGIGFIFSLEGSVLLKSFAWAFPSSCVAIAISGFMHGFQDGNLKPMLEIQETKDYRDMAQLWAGFAFMIAFLITFRTGKAYSRWWEGATLLQQARGEWVNCFSNCIAFCSANEEKKGEVQNFREYLALLLSLLFSAALNAITQADNNFEVLQLVELPEETLEYLNDCDDKVEVIICWIQTLIIQNMRKAVIDVPPPVLSRVFQELSRGIVNMKNVQKISVFLFPFPYAQLIGLLLLLFTILTPVVTGLFMVSYVNAFLTTFTSVFSLVTLNFVAMEIECPFGTDPNDLPMQTMQQYMNRTLELLLEPQAFTVPNVDFARTRRNLGPHRGSILGELPFERNTSPSSESEKSNESRKASKARRGSAIGRQRVDFAPRRRGRASVISHNPNHHPDGLGAPQGQTHARTTSPDGSLHSRTVSKENTVVSELDLRPVQEHEALSPHDVKQAGDVSPRWPPTTPSAMVLSGDSFPSLPSNGQSHPDPVMDFPYRADMSPIVSVSGPPITPKTVALSVDGHDHEHLGGNDSHSVFQEHWKPETAEPQMATVPEDVSLTDFPSTAFPAELMHMNRNGASNSC